MLAVRGCSPPQRLRQVACRCVRRLAGDTPGQAGRHLLQQPDHLALKAAGVDVDEEVTSYGGTVPPMFWVRDPDGNSLIVVQPLD